MYSTILQFGVEASIIMKILLFINFRLRVLIYPPGIGRLYQKCGAVVRSFYLLPPANIFMPLAVETRMVVWTNANGVCVYPIVIHIYSYLH